MSFSDLWVRIKSINPQVMHPVCCGQDQLGINDSCLSSLYSEWLGPSVTILDGTGPHAQHKNRSIYLYKAYNIRGLHQAIVQCLLIIQNLCHGPKFIFLVSGCIGCVLAKLILLCGLYRGPSHWLKPVEHWMPWTANADVSASAGAPGLAIHGHPPLETFRHLWIDDICETSRAAFKCVKQNM